MGPRERQTSFGCRAMKLNLQMKLQFYFYKMPAGFIFSVSVFLFPSTFTQNNPNPIYFLDKRGDILLEGPDIPENRSVVWEWKPHSGEEIQQLVTLSKDDSGSWGAQWSEHLNNYLQKKIKWDYATLNLKIRKPTFKLAGLFILTQTHPKNKTLKWYEMFGIKVESSPRQPMVGSDVTLSCTISKPSDTVSLHWKQIETSQQNRRNIDQIRLNHTIYLIIKHVTVEDKEMYVCEVQGNGSIIHKARTDFSVSSYLNLKSYQLYRLATDHSELQLICFHYYNIVYSDYAAWTWKSSHLQSQEKEIVSASRFMPFNVNRTHFGNRLVPIMANFNGLDFNVRITPVLFEDAGVYSCSLGSDKFVTIKLITVKVTAEPSDAMTEGDNVTLTCSVSEVTESMRLVWINSEGKTVEEKFFEGGEPEDNFLQLITQKADRDTGSWMCVLFHQNTPQHLVLYQKVSNDYTFKHTNVIIIGCLALLIIIMLPLILCLRKRKVSGLEKQSKDPLQSKEETSQLFSNHKVQQMQGQ
ncbi:uncharacterized protein LOC116978603 isoform X2 [Amblyraja radiata]|uniref:uncharacterized protein LOC116978603 isoform X2 n=1 Tax=Amblyraja radiata TaxID=386614 RepID=UPI001401D5FA|nr:uncharacterized protein LOC116978603 isoform X2 [Amblyraja radiata]